MDEILIVEENSNKELNESSNKNNTGNLSSETNKEEGYNDGGTSNDLKLAEENNYEKSVKNSLCSGSGETTTEIQTASETEFLKCNSESKIIDAQMFNVNTICKYFSITRNNDISFTSEIKDSISNDITETGGRENNIDSDSESELVIDESSGKALEEIDVENINPNDGEKVSEIFTSIIDDSIVKKKFAEVHQTNCSDNFENTVPNNFVQDEKINLTCSDEIFKSDSDSDYDILPPLIIDEVNGTEQNCNTDNSCNSFMLDSCNQKEFPEKFPKTNYDSTNSLTENLFQISEVSTEEESIHLSSIAFGVQKTTYQMFTKSIPFLKDRIVLMCSSDSFENPWLFTSSLLFGVFCNLYVDILLQCPERPSCEVLFNFFEKPASYKGKYVQDCSAMALMKCLILAKIELPPALEAWYETNGEDSKVKVIKYFFQRKHMSKTSENLSFDDVSITFSS
ncbi:uncharacterized protein CEXT_448691 [Caerostris extrusa]|uniref:Uncharacterized protein n=1 Tax=Caerostris extrusa TaxID=172846 RepID=A0AAV4X373_CAEEX|nr:uncharacterized protein CEXT_448691 [Caerostris extrusa]